MRDTLHLKELLHDAVTPSRLVPALSSGFVVGLLVIVVQLSLATLVFSGPLAAYAPAAAGLTLFGGFAMSLVVALGSTFPTAICLPEDAPAAIMASVAAGIASSLAGAADPRAAFVTVGAGMALSTMGSGVLFLIMGRFGLGNLMRYMPYPVVGGFLAGIGWLLVQGSFSIMGDVPLSFSTLPQFFAPAALAHLAPGVLLTLTLLLALRRWSSVFILPGVLCLSLGAFWLYLSATGQGLGDAERAGLLLGGMPEGTMLWPVFSLADLSLIRWEALLAQLPQLCTIPLASAISLLLISNGIETAASRDLDLRHELYLNGLANLLAGPGGTHTGYTALSFSMLGPTTGSDSRLVGVSAAMLIGVATFFGAAVLGSFPRFILGGMVLFLGVATLLDWVVAARKKVSWAEYGVMLAILCTIGFSGFLTGVGVGLVLATVVFVVKYSRLPVVRRDCDASGLTSARGRSVPDQHILREQAARTRVLGVTGYLFFGSAHTLGAKVAERLSPVDGPTPTHLVLDFTEVDGFDSSAVNCFLRMLQRCAAADCQVAFSCAPAMLEEQMRRAAPHEVDKARFLPDLDRALEWCEDAVLKREAQAQAQGSGLDKLFDLAVDELLTRLEESERFEALAKRLEPYLEHRRFAAGETLVAQGDPLDGVYLFLAGQAEEHQKGDGGHVTRLRSLGAGSMAGRCASAPGFTAPGSISAVTDGELAFLSAPALRRLEAEDKDAALAFYSQFSAALEQRLAPA